jgi:hypothetical protein
VMLLERGSRLFSSPTHGSRALAQTRKVMRSAPRGLVLAAVPATRNSAPTQARTAEDVLSLYALVVAGSGLALMASIVACFKLRAWRLASAARRQVGEASLTMRRNKGTARRRVKPTQFASSKSSPPPGERILEPSLSQQGSLERKMPWEDEDQDSVERQRQARAQGSFDCSASQLAAVPSAEQMLIEQVKERIRERAQGVVSSVAARVTSMHLPAQPQQPQPQSQQQQQPPPPPPPHQQQQRQEPPRAVAAERSRPFSVAVAQAVVSHAHAAGDATRAAMSRAGQHVTEIKLRPERQQERPIERRSTMDSSYSLDSTGSESLARSFGSGSEGSSAPKAVGAKWKPLRKKLKRLVVSELKLRPVSTDALRLIPEI